MASQRLSIRIRPALERRLKERAKLTGKHESAIAREALEKFLSEPCVDATAYDAALELGLIGSVKGTPKDLSTNPKHLRGFGKH
jgi:predicted DNA-binding protein